MTRDGEPGEKQKRTVPGTGGDARQTRVAAARARGNAWHRAAADLGTLEELGRARRLALSFLGQVTRELACHRARDLRTLRTTGLLAIPRRPDRRGDRLWALREDLLRRTAAMDVACAESVANATS